MRRTSRGTSECPVFPRLSGSYWPLRWVRSIFWDVITRGPLGGVWDEIGWHKRTKISIQEGMAENRILAVLIITHATCHYTMESESFRIYFHVIPNITTGERGVPCTLLPYFGEVHTPICTTPQGSVKRSLLLHLISLTFLQEGLFPRRDKNSAHNLSGSWPFYQSAPRPSSYIAVLKTQWTRVCVHETSDWTSDK